MRYCLNKTSSSLALRLVWPDCPHGSVGHNPLAGVQHKRGRRPYSRTVPGTAALGVSPGKDQAMRHLRSCLGVAPLASLVMASFSPRCEIRQLALL
jgi:hypothetical protein